MGLHRRGQGWDAAAMSRLILNGGRLCKGTSVDALIPSSEWPLNVWNLRDALLTKGRGVESSNIYFYNKSARINRVRGSRFLRTQATSVSGDLLDRNFIDFAKAC